MKKTLNLKPGDPVTCMRRYYAGNPYHGKITSITAQHIEICFYDEYLHYEISGRYSYGGKIETTPDSIIPGHIEPESLTLPETVEFETGDRVLARDSFGNWHAAFYLSKSSDGHKVQVIAGCILCSNDVREFDADFLFSQQPFEASETTTEPAAEPESETDEPKKGDWCAFWDEPGYVRFGKYDGLENSGEFSHRVVRGSSWKHARKLKPSDLSPELWAILKNEETNI